ncbi:MAG TPA: vWA domain-containing protein [Polyangiaceae bacterium]|nr:vWA domain-containing protein [Polyangiaceae bacterium]
MTRTSRDGGISRRSLVGRARLGCWLPAVVALALTGACGDDDSKGDGGGGGQGTGNLGGGGNVLVGTGATGSGSYEGGKVELTPEQAEALVGTDSVCAGWSAEPEGGPATLMIVVDTSQSMASAAPNSNTPKWNITRDALLAAVDALPGSAWVGIMFYPNEGIYNGASGVDLTECVNVNGAVGPGPLGGPDSEQRQLISRSVSAAGPGGCTPTHGAYVWGLNQALRTATSAPGQKNMLLITDGQPTLTIDCAVGPNGGSCSPANPTDKDAIQAEIATALATDGTKTWIIGSPGSEQNETTGEDVREWLSVAAELGGTATAGCDHDLGSAAPFCHFDMSVEPDFAAGLSAALASITGTMIGCEYDIPLPPADQVINRDEVNLVVTNGAGQSFLIKRASDPGCDQGWYYEGDRVILCGQTCADVENDVGASLDLTFGCASNEIPEVR